MYKINENYKEFISKREIIKAELNSKELVLKFLWKNPDDFTINALSNAPFFHLYFKDDITFLLIKFEGLNWLDIPCNFKSSVSQFFSSNLKKFPCKILLVNSNTGKLFINKTYFMPEGISKAFIQAIHLQKDMPQKQILRKINAVQASFSSYEMLRLSLGKTK